MITTIRSALATLGYTVHATRQEKVAMRDKEVVVVIDDVDVRIETTFTYRAYVWVLIEWDTTSPDNIPTQIVNLITDLEDAIADSSAECKATFKFIQSEVNQLGLAYRISVVIEYVDLIDIGA
jgi:hypothetical protein